MRRQNQAFLIAAGAVIASVLALLAGALSWAVGLALLATAAGIASRRWSLEKPGPMSHAMAWILRLPRGPHSPRNLIRILEPRPGEQILEIGPGIGMHAIPIADAIGPDGLLHVVDIQESMIEDLKARATKAGVTNIVTKTADATRLPYEDNKFDAAYLITVLGEIPEQGAALRELRRVIKPDGRLVIGEMIVDPDFVGLRALCIRVERAGFGLDRKQGPCLGYFARFSPEPSAQERGKERLPP